MKKVVYRGKIEKGVKRLISWYSLNAHIDVKPHNIETSKITYLPKKQNESHRKNDSNKLIEQLV
jgi:hypothetical protein